MTDEERKRFCAFFDEIALKARNATGSNAEMCGVYLNAAVAVHDAPAEIKAEMSNRDFVEKYEFYLRVAEIFSRLA